MSKNLINLLDYSRVELGSAYLEDLVDYLAKTHTNIQLIYLFGTKELIITDDKLLDVLNHLNIPYKESMPQNTLKFLMNK